MRSVDQVKSQQEQLVLEKQSLQTHLAENSSKLSAFQKTQESIIKQGDLAQSFSTAVVDACKWDTQSQELQYQASLFKKFAQSLEKEMQQNER